MNEFVLVEFVAKNVNDYYKVIFELTKLGDDFKMSDTTNTAPPQYSGSLDLGSIFGKMNSVTATFITLQNPYLAERMRISYIPDEMKDKYRNR